MHFIYCCSLPVWRRSFLKKKTPVTYFCPALDSPLGRSGRKTTTLVRDHEYFIPTKFHKNPSSGSGEEVENVNRRQQTTMDGRTDGRCAMTIAHLSLWLRWAKKVGQTSRTRSLGQKLRYGVKGLVIHMSHVKYESPTKCNFHGCEVMNKLKIKVICLQNTTTATTTMLKTTPGLWQ